MQTIALVGLGNPNSKYKHTKHNIGWLIIQALANHLQVQFSSSFNSNFAVAKLNNYNILLQQPTTYMNKSGIAVSMLKNFYKLNNNNIIVFSDDLDLDFLKIKHKINSGHGGHNGLKDIIAHIGNDFSRIKIGIGSPAIKTDVSNYVLSNFNKTELEQINHLQNLIIHNLPALLSKNFALFTGNIKANL